MSSIPKRHTASANSMGDYLIHPTAITVINNSVYVYDSHTGNLSCYASNPATNGQTASAKLSIQGVKKLTNNGTNLYALTETNGTKDLICISPDLASYQSLSFALGSYNYTFTKDFAVTTDKLFILKVDGNIDWFEFDSVSSVSIPGTHSKDNFIWPDGTPAIGDLISIEAADDLLHLSSENMSFNVNPNTYKVTGAKSMPTGKTVAIACKEYVLAADNCVINTVTGEHILALHKYNISAFDVIDGKIYFSAPLVHACFVYDISKDSVTDLGINKNIQVSEFSPDNFLHKILTNATSLYYAPYSIYEHTILPAGTSINIVGEYADFYYCLVVTETDNLFLYLPKATQLQSIDIGTGGGRYTATRSSSIFSLPSTRIPQGGKNTVLQTIEPGEEILVNSSLTLQNNLGELFYLTKTSSGYGFIRSSFLQSMRGTVELTNHNNAKTKRDTVLYENADGSGEIIALKKGTRISLIDDPAPNKTYLKAEYQDSKGVIYTGFVFSEDIKKDGLSTLQILGLILIVANLTVLALIILIKKRSKKWKHTTHSGDTNRPHHQDLT